MKISVRCLQFWISSGVNPPQCLLSNLVNIIIYLGGSPSVGVLLIITPLLQWKPVEQIHRRSTRTCTHKYVRAHPFYEYRKSDYVMNPRSPGPLKQNTGTLCDLYIILRTSKTKAEFDQEVTLFVYDMTMHM